MRQRHAWPGERRLGIQFRNIDASPSGILSWLFAPVAHRPEIRAALMATVIQHRPAVFISCAAVMIMSVSSALLTGKAWAVAWLFSDTALIAYRLHLSFRYDDGVRDSAGQRGAVIASMLALFIIFGLGCSLCIASGPQTLLLMALISVLGVFAGISSRWAAFPRLALATIAAIALPVCLAMSARIGGGLTLAIVQFAAIAAMTASQTMQNHKTLLRMITAEQQNAQLARSDALTGLGNRVRLCEDLAMLCSLETPGAPAFPRTAVLYLDLDGFKAVNDTYGHNAGDDLLRDVGHAIKFEAEENAVYRIGGDEFVVICARCDEVAVGRLAERIVRKVSNIHLDRTGLGRGVGVSIGIAFARHADQPETVLTRADQALYAAKRGGKARCYVADVGSPTRPLAA